MIRSADLQGKPVRTEDGERLGRVSEIHVVDGQVTVLVCGGRGLLQRFRAARGGRRVRWEDVRRLTDREIVVRSGSRA
ncbi:MAG: PRC-barrel domain-containing protein [Phenylobacterium sp.]